MEPVELPLVEPEVPVESVEPEVPVEPVDGGLVVEDEEPVEPEVPEASSVLRLQPPSVSTADNAKASRAAEVSLLDAYISVPFKEWRRLTVSQSPI